MKIGSSYGGNRKGYWDVPPYEVAEIISISVEPAASILRCPCNMRFEFLTAVFQNVSFLDVASCRLTNVTDILKGRMTFFVRVQRSKKNDYRTVQMLDISVGVNRQAVGGKALRTQHKALRTQHKALSLSCS